MAHASLATRREEGRALRVDNFVRVHLGRDPRNSAGRPEGRRPGDPPSNRRILKIVAHPCPRHKERGSSDLANRR